MENCKRGNSVPLKVLHPVLWIGFDWDQDAYEMDTDIMAFILNEKGQIENEQDIVFYNNRCSTNNAVIIIDDGDRCDWEFSVDFSRLPLQAQRLVFVHTIYNAGERHQTVSQINNCVVMVKPLVSTNDYNGEAEVIYTQESKNPPQELLIICELRRISGIWYFVPLSNGFDGDLESLCRHYGMKF